MLRIGGDILERKYDGPEWETMHLVIIDRLFYARNSIKFYKFQTLLFADITTKSRNIALLKHRD